MSESVFATPLVTKATVAASKVTTVTSTEHTLRLAAGKADPKRIAIHVDTETIVLDY